MKTPHKADNYTPEERRDYNRAYYRNNRERINAERKARRHLQAASFRARKVVLQTVLPPEVQECLFDALHSPNDVRVEITTTLQKAHLYEVFACEASRIVLKNDVRISPELLSQNLVKTSQET